VTDRNIVADMNLGLLIRSMNDDPVLDIHFVADMDAVDVSPHDCIEPDATLITDLHIPYHSGIRCEKTVFTKARGFAFYR
jgi:hypothetical protein